MHGTRYITSVEKLPIDKTLYTKKKPSGAIGDSAKYGRSLFINTLVLNHCCTITYTHPDKEDGFLDDRYAEELVLDSLAGAISPDCVRVLPPC